MRLRLETSLQCDFERAVAEVQRPRLLFHVARPLVMFAPCDGVVLDQEWQATTYWFSLRLFGVLPFGKQAVRVSFSRGPGWFEIRDNGYSRLIQRWDHRIRLESAESQTRYSDTLDLRAGLVTPLIWAFARVFYAHRQARWRRLAASGFDYDAN